MQAKLFKTTLAQFKPAIFSGTDTSGLNPIGDRVLVLPDKSAEKMESGLHLPEDIVARHTLAAEAGVLVAVGDGAFKWNADRSTPFYGRTPKVGDRVAIERYSGQLFHGLDGEIYRLMESACIGAVIEGKQ